MADPKYANLPGIDLNSPDVFETSELPEDDQAQLVPDEAPNENIDQTNLNASEAFGKFKGKNLDSANTDFSENVGKARQTGYDIPRTEYEMAADGCQSETPQQKYQRLQHEIRELSEQVTQVKESLKVDSTSSALSPVTTTKQVEYLQQQLTDLHLDQLLGAAGAVDLTDPQGALQKRLLSELESFQKPSDAKTPTGDKSDSPESDHVTYQLYYRPEQAKFSNSARLAELEQRLERMEALVGNNPESIESVALLSAKSKLLEGSHLDQIEGRVHLLGQKLGQVSEKKEAAEDSDKQKKISELYDVVKKWDSLANTLPHVVDRLAALKELHEQALQFQQALTHLDTAQQQIQSHLESHGDMVKTVRSTLTDNMSSIQSNCESLDKRVKSLT